ncbi:non-ribosomal peptide synthetase [Pseudoalteromonas sp. R3]|uniref:non-ribosomal peptide synthetase n=1 Tax=Pseudoalteromonas sp. R3 TaxID=1709477 RepID=UPI0006B4A126|nr:non-ribosomal peptide synthetase [Pseudoalteromonas sp. R3]
MTASTLSRAEKLARLKQLQQQKAGLALLGLSDKQQRFWFSHQLDATSGMNNIFRAYRFAGRPDTAALQQAIAAVMQQHPALTSKFVMVKDEPRQFSQPLEKVPFEQVPVNSASEMKHAIEAEAKVPFELSRQYPCRFRLFHNTEAADEYVLTLCFHHIALDGYSVVMVERAIMALYSGAISVPTEPAYTLTQLLATQSGDRSAMEQYWLSRLADTEHTLSLALNPASPEQDLQQGSYVNFSFDNALSKQITTCCQQLAITPCVFFLAAYQLLLHKLTGQHNFIVGMPELARTNQQQRAMVGNFANTLLIPAGVSPDTPVSAFISRLQQHFYQDLQCNQVTVERLVDLLGADRDSGTNPLFQVMFSFNNLGSGTPSNSEKAPIWQPYPVQRHYSKLDVTLEIQQASDTFSGYFEFRTALFTKEQVRQWQHQLATIINVMLTRSECTIGELSSFDYAQQSALLNQPQPSHLVPCFSERLIALSEHQGESIALVAPGAQPDQDTSLTYTQLLQVVRSVSSELRSVAQTGQTVAISCAQSYHCVIAMLAAQFARCAFVVIDPALPQSRREFIARDAQASVMLTDDTNQLALTVLDVQASTDPELGYLVYTSGSTGTPKGVRVTRQALNNHCQAVAGLYQLGAHTKALQFSVLSFDLALEEFFPILYHGGQVVLRPAKDTPSFADLGDLIARYALNHLSLPTGYLHAWMEQLRHADQPLPSEIKLVVTGTEQLQNRTVANWFALANPKTQRFINAYGPSEATISCSAHEVNQLDIHRSPVPIGSALPHSQVYVLDQQGHAVAPYVLGQLYIGGDNLAQGYQNLPEVSAEKFAVHPQLQQRLYATGDQAYYDQQGLLYFKGRIDEQVKFRGYRIELEEISRQLNNITGVTASICVVQQTPQPTLVAYVVSQAQLQQDKLNYVLAQTLPAYMLPEHIIQLDALPLTARGKIDKKALPKADVVNALTQRAAPNSQLEATLLTIWQTVLNKTGLCCETSFFLQGGHSLAALKVLSQITQQLDKELTLKQFFAAPSIAQQAQLLEQQQTEQRMSALQPVSRTEAGTLTHSQQQMYVLDAYAGEAGLYNMPLLVQLDGPLDKTVLISTLQALTTRHEALRTCFVEHQGEARQQVLNTVELPLQTLQLDEAEAKAHFHTLLKQKFDLTKPAYCWVLYQLEDGRHWLGLVIHHILCDGASMDVLIKELTACYYQQLQGNHWQPDHLTVQLLDYAHWQHTEQGQAFLAHSQQYWLDALNGMPHTLDLPLDAPRPARPSFRGSRLELTLPATQSQQLEQQASRAGVSLYTLSLCAFALLLQEQSRQQDFAIGIPVSGRPGHQLDQVVGLFVNSLPIRMTLTPEQTLTELLTQTQERILSGFDNQSLPLQSLVQLLDVDRALNYNPLFQVFFNFLSSSAEQSHPITDTLTLSLPDTPNDTARFDLTLTLVASPAGIKGHLEYSEELFSADTIALLRARYIAIMTQLASSLDGSVEALESTAQSDTLANLPQGTTIAPAQIPDLLAQLAHHTAQHPQQTALICGEAQWSYEALQQAVETRAMQLHQLGVQPGDLIAVSLPRQGDLLISLLAIFHCGAAYLPLDPDYPSERLSFIATDAGVRFVLSDSTESGFSLGADCQLVDINQLDAGTSALTTPEYRPENQAYCIYTSGSTGLPKGVDISRANMNNFLYAMAEKPGCTATDKLLAITPYSFDISVLELFLPLYCGATLVLANDVQSKDGAQLCTLIAQQDITLMQGTPATWRLLYSANWQGKSNLTCLVGGEALPDALAQQLVQDNQALWNMYGPTETTVWSSIKQILPGERVTIGCPIHNTQLYVLNEHNQLARFGAMGQLAIAGQGVAMGYRDRPELNAEKFVTLDIDGQPVDAYLTGDLVRQLGNGELAYLQRLDDQVKLRGYRIELQEIEAVLERQSGVSQCAVVINQTQTEPVLAAFYVAQSALEETQLVTGLSAQLPHFMVPTHLIALDTLPLTPSGKVDKKALGRYQLTQLMPYQAPQSETERTICDLWQNILGQDKVGLSDNFFKLGGNSILAMQLVAGLNEAFGLSSLTIADVLAYQSVSQLSSHIEQVQLSQVDDADLAALLMELEQE